MEDQLKQSYYQEIKYQTTMINNLKRWLRNSILFSSISLCLIIFKTPLAFLNVIGIIGLVISLIACLLIGLGIRNGSANVDRILKTLS